MSFGTVAAAVAGPLIGGLLGGASSSGTQQGGTETVRKDPWSAADPWLRQQIQTGQQLQNYYQQNPFNAQQQNAYGQLSNSNNYINQLVPNLLGQISGQPGFDRANPRARMQGVNFNVPNLGFGGTQSQNPVNMNTANNPFASGAMQQPVAQAPVAQARPSMNNYSDYSGGYL